MFAAKQETEGEQEQTMEKKKQMLFQKALAILLALSLVLGNVTLCNPGVYAYAGDGEGTETAIPEGGIEENEDGYLIYTAEGLKTFAEYVNEGRSDLKGELRADIKIDDGDWTPIGSDSPYAGTFNGNGYTVTLHMTENNTETYEYAGLFGYASSAGISNVVVDGTIYGRSYAGGIVGYGEDVTIEQCRNEAEITGGESAGGIVGYGSGTIIITQCANKGEVTGSYYAGGIVGMIDSNTTFTYCYNQGSVNSENAAAGILGDGISGSVTMNSVYSSASIEFNEETTFDSEPLTGAITSDYTGEIVTADTSVTGSKIFGYAYQENMDWDVYQSLCYCEYDNEFNMEALRSALNGEETNNVFVVPEGGGWPILKWEQSSQLSEEELEALIAKAKAKIEETVADKDYDEPCKEKAASVKADAFTDLDKAKKEPEITKITDNATADLNDIPTKAEKAAKKDALISYSEADYEENARNLVRQYKTDFDTKVDSSVSKEELEAELASSKAALDDVITRNKKNDLLKALDDSYSRYKEGDYKPENWSKLAQVYKAAHGTIEEATKTSIATLTKNNAIKDMENVQTILSELREKKKAEFTEYFGGNYKQEDYSPAKWETITNPNSKTQNKGYYNNALSNIGTAKSAEAIDEIIATAKANMEKVYTKKQEAELASYKARLKAELASRLAAVNKDDYKTEDYAQIENGIKAQKSNIDNNAPTFEDVDKYYAIGLKAIQDGITKEQRKELLDRIEEAYQRCLKNKADYDNEDWAVIEKNYSKKSELNNTSYFSYAKQWTEGYIRAMNNVMTTAEKNDFEAARTDVLNLLKEKYAEYEAKKAEYDQSCEESEEGWSKLEKINREATAAIKKVQKDEGKAAMTAIYEQAVTDMAAVTSLAASREERGGEMQLLTQGYLASGLYTEKGKTQLNAIRAAAIEKMSTASSVKAIQAAYTDGVGKLADVIESSQESSLEAAVAKAKQDLKSYFGTKYPEANKDKYEATDWETLHQILGKTLEKMQELYTKNYVDELSALRRGAEEEMSEISVKSEKIAKLVTECMERIGKICMSHTAALDFADENLFETFASFAYDLWFNSGENLKAGIEAAKVKIQGIYDNAKARLEAKNSSAEVTQETDAILSEMDSAEKEALTIANSVSKDKKWDGKTLTAPETGDGSRENPYQIGTAAELAWFAATVNNEMSDNRQGCGLHASLTADIDLAGYDWTPIAQTNDLNGKGYQGVFDGNEHTVHNMKIDTKRLSSVVDCGLFGTLGNDGVIKNLHVAGTIYFSKKEDGEDRIGANSGFGGVVGIIKAGTVYNCISSIKIDRDKYESAAYVGGIAGRINGGMIDSCRSYAFFTNKEDTAGYSYAGGIVGLMNGSGASYSMVRYCTYEGSFIAGGSLIGGIAGSMERNAIVRECINRAPIGKLETRFGSAYTGGIAGFMDNNAKVLYVYNAGEIKGGSSTAGDRAPDGTGGIVGCEGGKTATGDEKALPLISDAYNSGSVNAEKRAGGLVGRVTKGTIANAASCAGDRMFGYVENAGAKIENAILTEQVEFISTGKGNSRALMLAKLTHTQALLAKYRAEDDAVYGTQAKAYNDVIDAYIRKIEEATSEDAAAAAAAEAEEALAKVNTELVVQKEEATAQLRAYVVSHVYDSKKAEGEQSVAEQISALLTEALQKVKDAENLKGVSDVLMEYLGTEETAGKFAYFETYNTQTVKGLYSDFLYNKAYDAKDIVTVRNAYEKWAEAIFQADSEKKINELAAEAKKELTELTKKMTVREQGGNASLSPYAEDESDSLNQTKKTLYDGLAKQYNWKDYGEAEWASVCAEFEALKLSLKDAETEDAANSAVVAATLKLEAIETLNEQALAIAQTEAATTLSEKIAELVKQLQSFFDSKTKEIGAEKIEASHMKEALDAANTNGQNAIREAETDISFAEKTFSQIRETLKDAVTRAESAYQTAKDKLTKLFEKANNAKPGAWDGKTLTKPQNGDGTEENPYQITTGAELAWFSALVNGALTPQTQNSRSLRANANAAADENAHAVLEQDIDLSYKAWTPIGNGAIYRGVFDGKGHSVSGIYIKNESAATTAQYYGLFGEVYGGSVSNLTAEGEIAVTAGNDDRVGGIVGKIGNGGSISNCASEVDIQINLGNNDGKGYGGIAGGVGNASITSCVNRGSLDISSTDQMLCASAIGGIAGLQEEGNSTLVIKKCVNLGAINVYKAKGTGGILGYTKKAFTVEECANLADITVEENPDASGSGGTGGIVGVAELYAGDAGTIKNVYNVGKIKAKSMAGGILGGERSSGNVSAGGSKRLAVENCYNAGAIEGPNAEVSNRLASIAGLPIDGEYKNRVYMLEGSAKSAMGYISAKGHSVTTLSAEELKEKAPSEIFDGASTAISSIADINGGYPIFSWQLSLSENREQIVNYLKNYYETLVEPVASQKQQKEIEKLLADECSDISSLEDINAIITAYEKVLNEMNVEELLDSVKTEAKATLNGMDVSSYPQAVQTQIVTLKTDADSKIDAAKNAKEVDNIVNGVYAGIVDILITYVETPEFKPVSATASGAETYLEKIKAAKSEYKKLSDEQKKLVQSYIKITQAEQKYQEYCDRSAARTVDDKISAIGKVNSGSGSKIKAARNAYEALSSSAKKYVTLLNVLKKAESDLEKLTQGNLLPTENVIKMIDALGKITLQSYDQIVAATKAYNALTQKQAAAVPSAKVEMLKAAMNKYNGLLEAAKTGTVIVSIKPVIEGNKAVVAAETATLIDAVDTAIQVEANAILLNLEETEDTVDEIKLTLDMSAFKQILTKGKTKLKIKTVFGEILLEDKNLEKLINNNEENELTIIVNEKGNSLGLTQPEAQPKSEEEQTGADTIDQTSGKPFRPSDLNRNVNIPAIHAAKSGKDNAAAATDVEGTERLKPEETVQVTKENPISENMPFDWSILFMLIGIAVAAAIGGGLIKWFATAKRGRRK